MVRHSGKVSRYFLDGNELKVVTVNGANSFSLNDLALDFEGGLRKLGSVCVVKVKTFFLPREVSRNYVEYVKWKFLHRVFSSALQVLATQVLILLLFYTSCVKLRVQDSSPCYCVLVEIGVHLVDVL